MTDKNSTPTHDAEQVVWVNPRLKRDNVILLGIDNVAVATVDQSRLDECRMVGGKVSLSNLGPLGFGQMLELNRIKQISTDERDNWVTILLKPKSALKAALSKQPIESVRLKLASSGESTQLFAALREKVGAQFKFTRSEWSTARAALYYGMLPLLVGLLTWGLSWVQGRPDSDQHSSRKSVGRVILEPVLDALGQTGILLIGGTATFILLIWAIRKASPPPIMLKLKK